nr:hypothetical protein B0A51_16315 [Rachicladosporium sp. CCFEE 5018]
MSLIRVTRRSTPAIRFSHPIHRCHIADARPFREHDHVLLQPLRDRTNSGVLFRGPLRPGKQIDTHKGVLNHSSIIGKRVRDVVQGEPLKSGKPAAGFRLLEVKLDDYVRFSRRLVTPIYPADANLIVSLLDLHPEVYDGEDGTAGPQLEILEAGTGHGSLTLHLSRAVHAANPPRAKASFESSDDSNAVATPPTDDADWSARRRAVVHTIEISPRYAEHARRTVSAFRHGQYAGNIDFHVGDVSEWTRAALAERDDETFLSHAFLDLPNADTHIADVTKALRVDGTLIVFNPSITQITECALGIKRDGIPLELDRVIELGVNGGSGGREWDVRPVIPRAARPVVQAGSETADDNPDDSAVEIDDPEKVEGATATEGSADTSKWSMVCRPKVGERVVGGGFLGVWKKRRT